MAPNDIEIVRDMRNALLSNSWIANNDGIFFI